MLPTRLICGVALIRQGMSQAQAARLKLNAGASVAITCPPGDRRPLSHRSPPSNARSQTFAASPLHHRIEPASRKASCAPKPGPPQIRRSPLTCGAMNREWTRERLEAYKKLCEEYRAERNRAGTTERALALTTELTVGMPTVRAILRSLDPSLEGEVTQPIDMRPALRSIRAVEQGLGVLADWDEVAANLAPDAPSLVADQFHPHVWTAASALWDTGQYRVAVQQAAVSLSAHIAGKASSTLADRDLVAQVFSPNDPTARQTRLHLPGDETSRDWKSRQEGLHLLAQGAFAGIRNPATHSGDEWTEHVALEHLAVLSVIARWADDTEVATPS